MAQVTDITDKELFEEYRVCLFPANGFDGTFYSIPVQKFKKLLEEQGESKTNEDIWDKLEKCSNKWEDLANYTSNVLDNRESGMSDEALKKEIKIIVQKWDAISALYIPTVSHAEIADAYTNLRYWPDCHDTMALFREFYDTLDGHVDRMWFNPWLRCQLLLQHIKENLNLDEVTIL